MLYACNIQPRPGGDGKPGHPSTAPFPHRRTIPRQQHRQATWTCHPVITDSPIHPKHRPTSSNNTCPPPIPSCPPCVHTSAQVPPTRSPADHTWGRGLQTNGQCEVCVDKDHAAPQAATWQYCCCTTNTAVRGMNEATLLLRISIVALIHEKGAAGFIKIYTTINTSIILIVQQ